MGLDKRTRSRMDALRLRYPAVVDGQWIFSPEMEAIDRGEIPAEAGVHLTSGAAGRDVGLGESVIPNIPGKDSKALGNYLQADLRAVLSAKQLERWKVLCP